MSQRYPKYVRRFVPMLTDLGYSLKRNKGGRYLFAHPEAEDFLLHGTPSDVRAYDNDLARLKQTHPDYFAREKSDNRPSKQERQQRARRRIARGSVALSLVPEATQPSEPQRVGVPAPGSPDAVAGGCECPQYENRHGLGVEGENGIFAQVKHCPLHGWEDAPEPVVSGPSCAECGGPIHQSGRGRPRRYCESCRPSRWKQLDETERERYRTYWRAWRDRQDQEAA